MNVRKRASEDAPLILLKGSISLYRHAAGKENVARMFEQFYADLIARRSLPAASIGPVAQHAKPVPAWLSDEAFACLVGKNLVCGVFCGADMLADHDKVSIVARPMQDGHFHAVAIERARDGLLWMPQYTWSGAHAEATHASKIDGQFSFWTAVVVVTLFLILLGFLSDNPWPHRAVWLTGWLLVMKWGTSVFDITVQHPDPQRHEGSIIFGMLGYPDPDHLDLDMVRLDTIDNENAWRPVYRYKDGLKIHAGRRAR